MIATYVRLVLQSWQTRASCGAKQVPQVREHRYTFRFPNRGQHTTVHEALRIMELLDLQIPRPSVRTELESEGLSEGQQERSAFELKTSTFSPSGREEKEEDSGWW